MTSPLKKRIRFSIAKKVEILDLFQRGNSRADICWTYAIAPSTLFDFIENETKNCAEFESNRDSKRRTVQFSPYHDHEQAIIKWLQIVREQKIAISRPMVQEKALKFAKKMGLKDFAASGCWLDRFKKRENLDFKARRPFIVRVLSHWKNHCDFIWISNDCIKIEKVWHFTMKQFYN